MLYSIVTFAVFLVVLIGLARPLGIYMAKVMSLETLKSDCFFEPIERLIYKGLGICETAEMNWKTYVVSVVSFSLAGLVFLFFMLLAQSVLPFNAEKLSGFKWDLALNTAISFVTNTNWQAYSGESALGYFAQMAGLTVQNFVSAATGIAVLFAVLRGFTRVKSETIGNFWVDLTRVTTRVLLPIALVIAIALVSQGTIQNFHAYQTTQTQVLPMGPVASQVAIKQLGTNGGGFFGANSAHPFENPTPLSNFIEILAILLIPAALCFAMGYLVKDKRQGRALLLAMTLIFTLALGSVFAAEQWSGPQWLTDHQVNTAATNLQAGGNMEGKETRFGIGGSALFITATTAASCGAINTQHDSLTPLGSLVPIVLMQLGEIIFGGVGSGLYGMIAFVIMAVFMAGLMVGRTPEYLGKKIEPFEMKMASLMVLLPPVTVLTTTAIAVLWPSIQASLNNAGPHGFTEILYAFTSASNNNGSAFNGFGANTVMINLLTGLAMLMGRFGCMIPALAIAGSLAKKKQIPESSGTLVTHNGLFIGLLIAVILMIGALSFFPVLALGPIAEYFQSL